VRILEGEGVTKYFGGLAAISNVDFRGDQGLTAFLIEQNGRHALEIADRAYALENGRIVLEGRGGDLLDNNLRKAYLGS
jgi:ABC-type branched-subunit amino acid transport system ATPase component